jgi:hypothetical protein
MIADKLRSQYLYGYPRALLMVMSHQKDFSIQFRFTYAVV